MDSKGPTGGDSVASEEVAVEGSLMRQVLGTHRIHETVVEKQTKLRLLSRRGEYVSSLVSKSRCSEGGGNIVLPSRPVLMSGQWLILGSH